MPEPIAVSVIIPVYRAQGTLPAVLSALGPQVGPDTEVIAVDSTGVESAARLERAHPWLQVIGLTSRSLPGHARNIGAARARGSSLAFLDADTVPAADWLKQLRAAARTGGAWAVAGAIDNGTPGDAVGTATYLLEFSEFRSTRRGIPPHAGTGNLLVDRAAFEAAGRFCEDSFGEDTILTMPWGSLGRLQFAPQATVWHLNRTRVPDMVRDQFRLGRAFAAICDRVDSPHQRFSRWPLLPASPILRFVSLWLRLRREPALLRQAVRCAPLLVLGLTAWAAGLAAERARPTVIRREFAPAPVA